MNNKNNFSTPEGYFDKFHNTLMKHIESSNSNSEFVKPKSSSFISIHNQWRYAAAIVAMFVMGGMIYFNDLIYYNNVYAQHEELSTDYFDELLDNYPIDEYTFYSYITSN